jgi:hypothetical protein
MCNARHLDIQQTTMNLQSCILRKFGSWHARSTCRMHVRGLFSWNVYLWCICSTLKYTVHVSPVMGSVIMELKLGT